MSSYFSYIFLLLLLFIPSTTIRAMESSDPTKLEKNLLDLAENFCKKLAKVFTVSNNQLFQQKKLFIDQFPTVSGTPEKEVLSTALGVTKKLAQQGFCHEDITKAQLHYFDTNDGVKAWKALKNTYPSIANKTELKRWNDKGIGQEYKIFMSIHASKKYGSNEPSRLTSRM